jgi:hypothetical protein
MWQCQYVDSKGTRCDAAAEYRVHFSSIHPFSHTDCCTEHLSEYNSFSWIQENLRRYGEEYEANKIASSRG